MVIFIVFDCAGGYSRRIARAVDRMGMPTKIYSWKDFDRRWIDQHDPGKDLIFFRTGAPGSIPIARAFEDAGFRVANDSRYIQLSSHKYLANVHAQANGISVPELNIKIAKNNIELLSLCLKQYGPLVVKPIISRDKGRYVFLIKDASDFAVLPTIPGPDILVQSEVRFERLVRTIVTSEQMLVEATTYDVKRDSWKATVCENPQACHYVNIPPELAAIAMKTIRVFGGEIAYIDYFETRDGYVLSEINHSCGLIEHERISGYPIANKLAEHLVKAALSLIKKGEPENSAT